MHIIAISNISNGEENIGFRLLDLDNEQIMDVALDSVIEVLKSGNAKIDNLEIEEDEIVCTDGDIDDLPKIVGGKLRGRSPLVILDRLEDGSYLLSDYKGNITSMSTDELVEYTKEKRLSNGTIEKLNYKEFISSRFGEYVERILSTEGQVFDGKDQESVFESVNNTRIIIDRELIKDGFRSRNNYGRLSGMSGVYMDSWLRYKGILVTLEIGYDTSDNNKGKLTSINVAYRVFGLGSSFDGSEKLQLQHLSGRIGQIKLDMPNIEDAQSFYSEVQEFIRMNTETIKQSIDRIDESISNGSYILSEGAKVSDHLTTDTCNIKIRSGSDSESELYLVGTDGKRFKLTHIYSKEKTSIKINEEEIEEIKTCNDAKYMMDGIQIVYHMIENWTNAINLIEKTYY